MDESMNEEVKPTPHMDDPGLAYGATIKMRGARQSS